MSSKKVATPIDKSAYNGFGAPSSFGAHVFKINIPPGRAGKVVIREDFGYLAGRDGVPEFELRAQIERKFWTPLADIVKRDFNTRLRARRLPTGVWLPGDVAIERMLGKELCILLWAVEHAETTEQVEVIVKKWAALRPEERWWMYAMTAAEGGTVNDTQRGWHKALFHALSDRVADEGHNHRVTTADRNLTLFS